MGRIEYPYKVEESKIFGRIKRPRCNFEVFSKKKNEWILIVDALADTGADVTVLPSFIGKLLVEDITTGKYAEIKGIEPSSILIAFIHELKTRINGKEFILPIAIADSNDIPSILGRIKGLDLFKAEFLNGEKLILEWK